MRGEPTALVDELEHQCDFEISLLRCTLDKPLAQMAELVDAPDSKSGFERSAGSSPALGTNRSIHLRE